MRDTMVTCRASTRPKPQKFPGAEQVQSGDAHLTFLRQAANLWK
ncbi:MAG: hypothetical protein Ct9H90mP14_0510 [Methanobacteriota archaeon]|nr:MAG: hypothetical protein Ct9H90mP14_0510 [Euryarchaeota archaeon]